jgi:L-iditol 2-dehydrogenase
VRTVLLCGAGPAGLLFVQVLRRVQGFDGTILVSEVNAKKRALAESFGAEAIDPSRVDLVECVREKTAGRMVEYLIEATGSGAVFAEIPSLIRKQATVLKYGIGYGGQSLEVINRLHWKEPTFLMPVGASGHFDHESGPRVYKEALRWIEQGTLDVASIVSHRYDRLESLPAAFAGDHTRADYVKGIALL